MNTIDFLEICKLCWKHKEIQKYDAPEKNFKKVTIYLA